jgi:predicted metalloendopeptidase
MLKIAAAAAALCLATAGLHADISQANSDPAVRPQDDFYRHVNGGWLRAVPIPAEYSRWGAVEELRQANTEDLHLLCERASAQGNDASPIEQKVGDFYASGMDEASAAGTGLQPLAFEFARIESVATPVGVLAEVAHLHAIGVDAGFGFGSETDRADSRTAIATLDQGGLGLPERDYYLRADERSRRLRSRYEAHVARMLEYVGYTAREAQAGAAAVMRLETSLAAAALDQVALRDPHASYHKMTVDRAVELSGGLDLPAYFAATGAPALTELNLAQPGFLKAFSAELGRTPVDAWKAYLRWHVIHSFAPFLGDAIAHEDFAFYGTALTGARRMQTRWKRVVTATDEFLGEALGQLYVADYFPPESKVRALRMVAALRAALRARLAGLEWMDEPTRARALAKLDAMGVKIGYPDTWRDYSTLVIDRGPYVINVLKAKAFEVRRNRAKIGRPVDTAEWRLSPATVNAYYSQARNEIVFPAAILQPPLFDAKADDAVNFGAIGAIIGHEMSHGFDDAGRQYDEKGNLSDWWTPASAARFKERAAAIVRQFNEYPAFPDLRVNGELTEGENIADLGGVRIAYAALEAGLEGPPGKKADGLTPEQRFFTSYASMWRTKYRPEYLRLMVNTNPHAPGEFRCNGPLSNMDEFAAAFGVPEGAPMRRPAAERVTIW